MAKLHVKKDDTVVVITGKNKGKKGKVLTAIPEKEQVIVEGVNMATKHKKPRSQTQPGGIIHQEAPIHASNVMFVCPRCGKATRLSHQKDAEGANIRVCKKCHEQLTK
jgi:large subunit ribosomal protein L24